MRRTSAQSRLFAPATVLVLTLAGAASGQTVTDSGLAVTPYATGLSLPTQIRFIGPGDMLVTEKNSGSVKRYINGVFSGELLNLSVANDSERGLLGITPHPDFATNNQVYLYYSENNSNSDGGTWTDNRLARYTLSGSAFVPDGTFTPITFGTSADGQANGPNHDAGPITFGPDGKLYGTTGDLNRDRAEQNDQTNGALSALVGGVYRLNDNGTVPSDNPFTGNANANFHRWFGYGVRNTFGIAFDPVTNRLWETENGPGNYDEINLIPSGFNGGWNPIMGPDSRNSANAATDLVNLPGSAYSDPEFSFFTPVAVTGIEFLAGSLMDAAYHDAVVVGANNTGELYLLRLNETRDGFVLGGDLADHVADTTAERNLTRFGQGFGALTDLQVGPDGALYATSIANGIVYRIAPVPEPAATVAIAAAASHFFCRRRRLKACIDCGWH